MLARHQANANAGAPPRPVDLASLARQALSQAAPEAQSREVDLGLARADAGAIVEGHEEALRVMLRNLLDNAIRYTPPGGRVDVEVARTAAGATLRIDDSGPGIPEAERGRVLDRFHRLPGTSATGSGLGLSIVKAIAELHRAALELSASSALGGLRVDVRFPSGS